MTCPKCGSNNITVQIIQERKYGSFLTFIVRVILFFWIFFIWLLSLLFRTSRIKNKTVAVCSSCGNTWKPKPRNELKTKRKQERALIASKRRTEITNSLKASGFWRNEYFGYFMIFLFAPYGIFLMYKYNQKLETKHKKTIAILALAIWFTLFITIAIVGIYDK